MISILITILFIVILFKLTGCMFHIAGKLLGWLLGGIGWLILAVLAISVIGLAVYVLPIILIIGLIARLSEQLQERQWCFCFAISSRRRYRNR